jgi:hypothetical protein
VNLDAATGKLRWYYQGVPNDFKDSDMQASPISARTGGVPVVIGSGKMGYVYEMNASTGKLIWKAPVGEHDGHDNDSLQALEHRSTLKAPLTIVPGSLGGVLADLAVASSTVYVATIDLPLTYTNLNLPTATKAAGSPTGEVEALRLATGKVEWDEKLPQLPLGAATVSNDLVFTTLYNGVLIALDRSTGAVVYRRQLPTSANSPIAIVGNTVIVPAGGPMTSTGGGEPQVVAYTVPEDRPCLSLPFPAGMSLGDPLSGRDLAAFVTAVETGTVQGAADALALTQSAVTKRLQALERRIGRALLERTAQGVCATEVGERLYPLAREALTALLRAEVDVTSVSQKEPLVIHSSQTIGETLVPQWLASFASGHPWGAVTGDTVQGALDRALGQQRESAPYRRLELRCRAAAPDTADRAGGDAAAAVLADRARHRGRDPSGRRAGGNRRDRLLPDGIASVHRADDTGADRGNA